MIKYMRKQINKDADLHDKEFVRVDNVIELMEALVIKAVECGADEDKLLSKLNVN